MARPDPAAAAAFTPPGPSEALRLIGRHEERRRTTINLVASENLMSPAARAALQCDLAHRYMIPPRELRPPDIWDYPNQDAPRAVERLAKELACTLFHGRWADVRPLSGNNVAGILLAALAAPGDDVLTVPAAAGGHFATPALCGRLGLARGDLPYDPATGRVSLDRCAALAREVRPRLIYLDASMILFPYPVGELRDLFGRDCVIAYDASHCFGVIAGGAFQSPLPEGADLIAGSTHKSLFGPQKGMIVAREDGDVARSVNGAITPLFVSNAHVHHVAALAVALEECAAFGRAYAAQVVANARRLAQGLASAGIEVLYPSQGFTECHQIICVLDGAAFPAMQALQAAGIHVNAVTAPFGGRPGLRLGAAEVTRRGFGAAQIDEVARCMADVLLRRRPEADVARRVGELSLGFQDCRYGFDLAQAAASPAAEPAVG